MFAGNYRISGLFQIASERLRRAEALKKQRKKQPQ